MTPEELAARLNGRECGSEITPTEEKEAKDAGLVVVFGASDDMMEFRGAIDAEISAYEGTIVHVNSEGLQIDSFRADFDGDDYKDQMRDFFRREGKGREIEALWCENQDAGWEYRTDIPNAKFTVLEEGDPYCIGIVFRLSDAGKP